MTTTKFTTRQIAEIARATKACSRNGMGLCISVFSDGDCRQGVSENDVIARGDGNGGWDHRIACIKYPMTREQVAEEMAYALSCR